ncbi:hypothetical protein PAAG_00949 [Paracoccidioides lutzii Pb01]|uniref:Uncharacterized protein n=1 Tax=Paracoccidioides lutzii (strain ATCC MYA-826 / Pb01) TaxID=502779 RepID=C1GR04_PARBA|nr:hypothetical protein PAAG_00949 [Paracoccidioides lutzii Pb01]EEH38028.2 hypothetical protein PAAG_00949 [Paracoccidioides lutzii Pb01]
MTPYSPFQCLSNTCHNWALPLINPKELLPLLMPSPLWGRVWTGPASDWLWDARKPRRPLSHCCGHRTLPHGRHSPYRHTQGRREQRDEEVRMVNGMDSLEHAFGVVCGSVSPI